MPTLVSGKCQDAGHVVPRRARTKGPRATVWTRAAQDKGSYGGGVIGPEDSIFAKAQEQAKNQVPRMRPSLDLEDEEGEGTPLRMQEGFAQFRPPSSLQGQDEGPAGGDHAQVIREAHSGARKWHEAAWRLQELKRQGHTPKEIDDMSAMPPREQALCEQRAAVLFSLKDGVSEGCFAYLEGDGKACLEHLRNLDASRRRATAEKLAEQRWDEGIADEVVRAYKLFDLFPNEAEGFAELPGDVLAFKCLRQANQARREQDSFSRQVERALSFVQSESAAERLHALQEAGSDPLSPEAQRQSSRQGPSVEVVRLEGEETAVRAMPLLGEVFHVDPSHVAAVPKAGHSGPFSSFRPSSWRGDWLVMPEWAALDGVTRPCGVFIPSLESIESEVPWLEGHRGAALAIVDPDAPKETQQGRPRLALVKRKSPLEGGERVELAAENSSTAGDMLGAVVLLVRPPAPKGSSLHAGMETDFIP